MYPNAHSTITVLVMYGEPTRSTLLEIYSMYIVPTLSRIVTRSIVTLEILYQPNQN